MYISLGQLCLFWNKESLHEIFCYDLYPAVSIHRAGSSKNEVFLLEIKTLRMKT